MGAIVSYADTQAYGFAALFGLVNDLKLFVLKAVGGKPVIDTTKYQLSAGMSPLGAAAVRISPLKPPNSRAHSLQGQYPLLLLAQYLPAGRFYGAVITYIGLTAILVIVCNDFADIMALRYT